MGGVATLIDPELAASCPGEGGGGVARGGVPGLLPPPPVAATPPALARGDPDRLEGLACSPLAGRDVLLGEAGASGGRGDDDVPSIPDHGMQRRFSLSFTYDEGYRSLSTFFHILTSQLSSSTVGPRRPPRVPAPICWSELARGGSLEETIVILRGDAPNYNPHIQSIPII